MKSSWKKQRLATKKKHIKQIRYKKRVFKKLGIDLSLANCLTLAQLGTMLKRSFRSVKIAIQRAWKIFTERLGTLEINETEDAN